MCSGPEIHTEPPHVSGLVVLAVPGDAGEPLAAPRGPQSMQSVPMLQIEYSAPGPPSSQSLSDAWKHVLLQPVLPAGAGGGAVVGLVREPQQRMAPRPVSLAVHCTSGT